MLILENQVLLIKHHRLQRWLCPGGHIEINELPHVTAEREFEEETGVEVKAFDINGLIDLKESEYLPCPIISNLHWMYKINYEARIKHQPKVMGRLGCEQHLGFAYLMAPVAKVTRVQDLVLNPKLDEIDDIGWFSFDQVKKLQHVHDDLIQELKIGFGLIEQKKVD